MIAGCSSPSLCTIMTRCLLRVTGTASIDAAAGRGVAGGMIAARFLDCHVA
jgi:hypothetical protein